MKQVHVYDYEMWGSTTQWPVRVYLTSSGKRGWEIEFEYLDPENTGSDSYFAESVADLVDIARQRGVNVGDFAFALQSSRLKRHQALAGEMINELSAGR
jgi:hypothetical protein